MHRGRGRGTRERGRGPTRAREGAKEKGKDTLKQTSGGIPLNGRARAARITTVKHGERQTWRPCRAVRATAGHPATYPESEEQEEDDDEEEEDEEKEDGAHL